MLSYENIERLVFTGIYTASARSLEAYETINNSYPWDQRYDYWIPICVPNKDGNRYYMVNTYQVEPTWRYSYPKEMYQKTIEAMEKNRKDGSAVYYGTREFYYSSGTLLDDENIELFHLIADLKDYDYVPWDEVGNYEEEDVLTYIRPYRDENQDGICLKRKGAKEVVQRMIDNIIDQTIDRVISPYIRADACDRILALTNAADATGEKYNVDKVLAYLAFFNDMQQVKKLYNKAVEDLDKRLEELEDD